MADERTEWYLTGRIAGRKERWPLKDGRYHVGRDSTAEIYLGDPLVSRRHAEFVVSGETVSVRDLGSSNGTTVNGRRVTEAPVTAGDLVGFGGNVVLALHAEGAPQPSRVSSEELISERGTLETNLKMSLDSVRNVTGPETSLDTVLFRSLTEAGQFLVHDLPMEEVFESLLDLVERVVPARRILLLLRDAPEASLEVCAARPPVAATRGEVLLSRTIMDTVLEEREAVLVTDAQTDPRFSGQESIVALNVRSALIAPLFDNEQVIGLAYADSDDPRVRYNPNQLRAFAMLANLMAVKITNTRLHDAQREKQRMEQELRTAARIQQTLLSSKMPDVPGYEIVTRQVPCFEVGGDLYDLSRLEDGRIAVVVGDVTGKGMGAAMLMSNVLASLRILYQENPKAATFAERLHRQVLRSSDDVTFVTLFMGLLDPETAKLRYVNAGHNPPYLICKDGKVSTLNPTGMPIGMMAGATYEVAEVTLPEDCLLCVFSDGITEAQAGEELYGEERLIAALQKRYSQTVPEIADGIIADVEAFVGDEPQGDDVTLLLLRYRGKL